ncbi:MAG TPA: hypothetical protein PKD09_00925 [Aggregatilinea sp.]|uniref:hypothetical protein n=1 Tax=Aggregatilinea sp. TaxID=2806333 RepID=UPI002D1763AF|nr:hypothetical protein [Aggregatilinea sp.]HML20177.1 hypothetical protein [Aggregatilinea sp.]
MEAQKTGQTATLALIRARRDAKAKPHLTQYAPVWMVGEEFVPDDDAVRFSVVFCHPKYSWVTRRYRFDGYNDVLYYLGEMLLDEDKALDMEITEPYISAEAINTLDSYGG